MKKLRSERGASILMALVLLLLASMVSAVILTAATSAARRVRNDREAQRDYLLVSSAAEMIRDSIQADEYYREVWFITYKDTIDEDGKVIPADPKTKTELKAENQPNGTMGEWLAAGIDGSDATAAVTIKGSEDTIEISMPEVQNADGEAVAFKTVVAEFKMDGGSGNITVKLRIKPENESADTNTNTNADSEEDCRMTLTLRGNMKVTESQASEVGDGVESIRITGTTITWESGKIVKGIKEAASEQAEK